MTLALTTAALAPLHAEPDVRTELVSQAAMGHLLTVREEKGCFLRVRTEDGYPGWINEGYVRRGDDALIGAWRQEAALISLGAALKIGDERLAVPLGARLVPGSGEDVKLPDGRAARLDGGRLVGVSQLREEARAVSPAAWALEMFAGAPYLFGGMTPWGVDSSGLVQVTYLVRGVTIPRDSAMQAEVGEPVEASDLDDAFLPGDLLFFTAEGEAARRIGHAGIADGRGGLVHAWLAAGGVVTTPLSGSSPEAERLRRSFVRARRPEPGATAY